jgi:hypothetical protein
MKDEWWLELFEKRRQATIARQRSASNPIPRRELNLQSWPNVVERKVQFSVLTFILNNPHPPFPQSMLFGIIFCSE